MLVVDGSASRITATEQFTVMLLGGEPVGQRYIDWNFVSSSRERLPQAAADWKAERMKLPDADNAEFIPLPDEPAPPAPPMS
jgi:redox-sensitive bicupin YhaK (pirin superfamily)